MLGTRIDGKGNLIGVGGPYEEFSKAHVRKNVRFESKPAATDLTFGVRFHPGSGLGSAARPRLLWAISGLMHCNKRTYRKTGGLSEIQSGVLIRQVRVRQTVSTLRSTDKAGELEPVANHPAGTRFN